LPTLPVLIAYVNACGGDVAEWEERWGRLTKAGKKGPTALPAAGQDAASQDPVSPGPVSYGPGAPGFGGQPGQGGIPQGARQTGEIYVITSAKQRDSQW
jgi:hypothetical protein